MGFLIANHKSNDSFSDWSSCNPELRKPDFFFDSINVYSLWLKSRNAERNLFLRPITKNISMFFKIILVHKKATATAQNIKNRFQHLSTFNWTLRVQVERPRLRTGVPLPRTPGSPGKGFYGEVAELHLSNAVCGYQILKSWWVSNHPKYMSQMMPHWYTMK